MREGSGSNVMKKRGSYWYRRRVPADLIEQLGKEITRPLNTTTKREAERLARAYSSKLETGFAAMRAGLTEDVEDSRSWVRSLADKALDAIQKQVDDELAESLSQDHADEVAEAYDEQRMVLMEAVDNDEPWAIANTLSMGGIDPASLPEVAHKVVAVGILRAAGGLKFDAHSLRPKPSTTTSPDLDAIQRAISDLVAKVDQQGKAKDARTIGEALEVYAAVKAEMRGETAADVKGADLFLVPKRFAEFVGIDRNLDKVRTEDLLAWLDAQNDQRSNTPKPIGTGTRNRFVGSVSTFFDVAVQRGWALQNPAKGLRVTRRRKAHERRHAFDLAELQKLFTPELRAEVERGFAERWFVPCIQLLNGTRTNEACQLRLRDVVEVDGIPCLRIMPEDATQSTKTEESDRVVPIHPQLANDLGLLDYVASRRAETEGDPKALLFPNLTFRRGSGYKTKVVNFFAGQRGYLQRIGIREDQKKTLYSLRHNFITAAERAAVPDLARTQLTGHARQGDQGKLTYISDRQAHELLTELSKVDWSDVLAGLG